MALKSWLLPVAGVVAAISAPAAAFPSVTQAQAAMFPGAAFAPNEQTLNSAQIAQIQKLSGQRVLSPHLKAWRVSTGGWFIVDQVIGKHELITYAVGINPDGSVRQFQVIEYREAYGYQVRELKWRDQFVGKTLADPLKVGVDIVNISGGTLSSQHVTDGIKRLLAFHQVVLR